MGFWTIHTVSYGFQLMTCANHINIQVIIMTNVYILPLYVIVMALFFFKSSNAPSQNNEIISPLLYFLAAVCMHLCFEVVNAFQHANNAPLEWEDFTVLKHINISCHYYRNYSSRSLNRWSPLDLPSPQWPPGSMAHFYHSVVSMLTTNTLFLTSLWKAQSVCVCVYV